MRLEIVKGLQHIIIAFIFYIISITFAGWFESYIAKQVGDDTPERSGFLTLNPLEHFNVFGFGAVLWGMFFANLLPFQLIPGWGRYIPLVPDNIHGPHSKLRIFIEYTSRSCAHLLLLICSVTIMMIVCGATHVHGIMPMISSNASSLKEVVASLLSFMCHQNLVLFVIHFILGCFKYLIYFHMPNLKELSFKAVLLGFILLLVGLSIFGPLLEIFAAKLIEGIRSILLLIIK